MSVASITPLDCGWLRTQQRTLVAGGSIDEIRIPVTAWLVRHPRGEVVFDLGLHPALAEGSASLGRLAKLFSPDLDGGGTIAHRLAEHDVDADGPLTVVVSHCHFDHVGGLCELPNARVIVQRDEWSVAMGDDDAGYDRSLYDLGHAVTVIAGPHDVFGEGSVVTLPTPGHTCGHQSLLVRTADGPVILAADACYFAHTLDDDVLPPFAFDLAQQRESLAMLRRERDAGTTVIPGHDVDTLRHPAVTFGV